MPAFAAGRAANAGNKKKKLQQQADLRAAALEEEHKNAVVNKEVATNLRNAT